MIDSFKDNYSFLSNFHPVTMDYDSYVFPSVENAFQAAKSNDPQIWMQMTKITPSQSKKLGRQIVLRSDWETIKLRVMEELLRVKFGPQHPSLRAALAFTRGHELVEGNWWGDTYWGICRGIGQNNLGKLLMKIREEIK